MHRRSDLLVLSVAVAAIGMMILLAGLTVDLLLHARGHHLDEGPFSLENPGHLVAAVGLAVALIGVAGAVTCTARQSAGSEPPSRRGMSGLAAPLLIAGMLTAAAWAVGFEQHQAAPSNEGTEAAPDHPTGSGPKLADLGEASADEIRRSQGLLDRSIEATAGYRDTRIAERAGYVFKLDRPRLALHVFNPVYLRDGDILNPSRPEGLVYLVYPTGRLELVGVVYIADGGVPGPTIGGPITRWHGHRTCLDPSTDLTARPSGAACPPGQVEVRSNEMMHVWFTDDLSSAFAETVPLEEFE
jgi:hypothetical protein